MAVPNLSDLSSSDPKIKYGCAKQLLAVARENPAALYPDLEFFVKLLDSENNILKWTATDIIGLLSPVDEARAIDGLLGTLFGLLKAGKLITANHAIAALTDIAVVRPEHRAEITAELLKVEHYNYDTLECRNIAIGKVILALGRYYMNLEDKGPVMEFVRRQAGNARPATRKKAEQFLKKNNRRN